MDRGSKRWRWTYGSRTGMVFGLALYALEALQSIALIPFFRLVLGPTEATYWVAITTSLGLVSLASAGYFQPLIRNVAAASPDHEHPSVPGNWTMVLRRVGLFGKGLLLVSQCIFLWLALGPRVLSEHGLWPALIFFAAMQLRLAAFDHFALLNGLRQVGRDKQLLIVTSVLNLTLVLGLGSIFRDALALAAASLAANSLLLLLARRAARQSMAAQPDSDVTVHAPPRREMLGLVMLSLGGYLNLSTDIVISARMLPAETALDYAFWSRLFLTQVALVGLAAQVRFPFWASRSRHFGSILSEIGKGYWLLLVSGALLVGAFLVNSQTQLWNHGTLLPLWMIGVMALTAYVSSMTVLLGQALTVRNSYAFLRPSIVLACLAPVAAVGLGRWLGPQTFVLAYLAVNLSLFAVTLKCSRDHLREQADSPC